MIHFRRIVFLQAVVCLTIGAGNGYKAANRNSRKAQFFVTVGLRQASTTHIPRL